MTNSRETSTKMTEQNFSNIGEKLIYAIENGLFKEGLSSESRRSIC